MASSTMTLPRVTDSNEAISSIINSAPKAPNSPLLTVNDSARPFSILHSLSKDLLQPLKLTRIRSGECRPYWDGLGLEQQRECVDHGGNSMFGEKTGWPPAGAVLQRWDDELLPTINSIQNEQGNGKWIFRGHCKHPVCTVELWMIEAGRGIDSARPTIVAKCSELKFAKRTLFVLQKIPSFVDLNLGFSFLPWNDVGSVGGSEGHNSSFGQYPLLGGSRIFTCSSPFSPLNSWNRATLGGVLLLNKYYYGLTVAHAFDKGNDNIYEDFHIGQSDDESGWADDFELFQTQCGASVVEEEDHDSSEEGTSEHNVVYFNHCGNDLPASTSTASEVSKFRNHLSFVGYLPESGEASSLTVEPSDEPHASKWISTKSDWALIRIHDPRFYGPNKFVTPEGKAIVPSRSSYSPPRGNVFLATSNNELRQSYCFGVKSGIFLPNSTEMQETWTLDTPCSPGECGSWVMDAESEEDILHGIIVASSKVGNVSYLLPAFNILEDIKSKWRDEIGSADQVLPTEYTETSAACLQADIPLSLDKEEGYYTPLSLQQTASSAWRGSTMLSTFRSGSTASVSNFKSSEVSQGPLSESTAPSSVLDLDYTTHGENNPFSQDGSDTPRVSSRTNFMEKMPSTKANPHAQQAQVTQQITMQNNGKTKAHIPSPLNPNYRDLLAFIAPTTAASSPQLASIPEDIDRKNSRGRPTSHMASEEHFARTPGQKALGARLKDASLDQQEVFGKGKEEAPVRLGEKELDPSQKNVQGPSKAKDKEELLDSRYFIRTGKNTQKFFQPGRVFAMLWHQNAGHNSNPRDFQVTKYKEYIYSAVRRMVVVKALHGASWCCPIHTYNGRGVSKGGFTTEDIERHSIIYMKGTKPIVRRGEQGMIKKPIEFIPASPHQKLDPMSRLNFGKLYTVEHNIKAMDVGMVSQESMPYLLAYFRDACDSPQATATAESAISGISTTDESNPRTVDKQSATNTGLPFPLSEPALPESPDNAIKWGPWTKSSSDRMYRILTIYGEIYTQWDNEKGYLTASGLVVSTTGSNSGNGSKLPKPYDNPLFGRR